MLLLVLLLILLLVLLLLLLFLLLFLLWLLLLLALLFLLLLLLLFLLLLLLRVRLRLLLLLALLLLLLLVVSVLLLLALLVALRCGERGLIWPTAPLLPLLTAWRHNGGRCGRFYLVWHALPLLIARAKGLRIAQGGHGCFVLPLADLLGQLQPFLSFLRCYGSYPFQYLCLRVCTLGNLRQQVWHLILRGTGCLV